MLGTSALTQQHLSCCFYSRRVSFKSWSFIKQIPKQEPCGLCQQLAGATQGRTQLCFAPLQLRMGTASQLEQGAAAAGSSSQRTRKHGLAKCFYTIYKGLWRQQGLSHVQQEDDGSSSFKTIPGLPVFPLQIFCFIGFLQCYHVSHTSFRCFKSSLLSTWTSSKSLGQLKVFFPLEYFTAVPTQVYRVCISHLACQH